MRLIHCLDCCFLLSLFVYSSKNQPSYIIMYVPATLTLVFHHFNVLVKTIALFITESQMFAGKCSRWLLKGNAFWCSIASQHMEAVQHCFSQSLCCPLLSCCLESSSLLKQRSPMHSSQWQSIYHGKAWSLISLLICGPLNIQLPSVFLWFLLEIHHKGSNKLFHQSKFSVKGREHNIVTINKGFINGLLFSNIQALSYWPFYPPCWPSKKLTILRSRQMILLWSLSVKRSNTLLMCSYFSIKWTECPMGIAWRCFH